MNSALPLKERILAAAAETPSPTRAQGRRRTWGLLAMCIVLGIVVFDALGGLASPHERPLALTVRLADGWGLASSLFTWLVFRYGAPYVTSRKCLAAVVFVGPVAMCVWASFFVGQEMAPVEAGWWRCLVEMLVTSAAPLAVFLCVHSGREPKHPGWLGAAAGSACASWAGVATFLRCPTTTASHVLLGHALPMTTMALVGYLLGVRTLIVRRMQARAAPPISHGISRGSCSELALRLETMTTDTRAQLK
jgi:negative regulator of sigma F NrsF-like protein